MLTKSNFLLGRQCEKALWLRFNNDGVRDPVGIGLQRLFNEGQIVGKLAHKLYPNGHLIKTPSASWQAALAETKSALDNHQKILFEPAFLSKDVLVRPDILVSTSKGWDLIEVKSSTSVKDEHIDDVAIQMYVLKSFGLPINDAFLLHVNSDFVRNGELDVELFFIQENITGKVDEILNDISSLLERLQTITTLKEMPTLEVGSHCKSPYECRYTTFCWKSFPPTSIHYLPNLRSNKRALLTAKGISDQREIPESFDISDKQKAWVQSAKSGEPIIDINSLKEFLDDLKYPLTFLDFETVNTAVPPFDGLSPYHQLPFQASVRVIEANGKSSHKEFLGDGISDPRNSIAQFLADAIPNDGSIIAYYASFEKGRLEELAESVPDYAVHLRGHISRLADLRDPFADGYYVDSRSYGSTSIKEILPVLVPEMTYQGLAIADGGAATAAYIQLSDETLSDEMRQRICSDLRAYCGQDTLAMVRVVDALRKIAG